MFCPRHQRRFVLSMIWIGYTTIDRTDQSALLAIVKPNALRAFLRDDIEEALDQRRVLSFVQLVTRTALVDRGIRAFRLASTTVDANFGYTSRHRESAPAFNQ